MCVLLQVEGSLLLYLCCTHTSVATPLPFFAQKAIQYVGPNPLFSLALRLALRISLSRSLGCDTRNKEQKFLGFDTKQKLTKEI